MALTASVSYERMERSLLIGYMRSYKSNLYVDTFTTIAFYCMYMSINFVHTAAFNNCRYRYCYLQFVAIAF